MSLAYILSTVAAIVFFMSYIPDVLKSIESKEIKGVTVKSPAIVALALVCAAYSNFYFGNWPLFINDCVCFVLNAIILYNRKSKI